MRKLYVMLILFILAVVFITVAVAEDDNKYKTYLPNISNGGESTIDLSNFDSSTSPERLIESIPLDNGTILVLSVLSENPGNFVSYTYDKFGAYTLLEGWENTSGLPVKVQIRDCAWVVVEGEYGISVHKISLPQFIDESGNVKEVGCLK